MCYCRIDSSKETDPVEYYAEEESALTPPQSKQGYFNIPRQLSAEDLDSPDSIQAGQLAQTSWHHLAWDQNGGVQSIHVKNMFMSVITTTSN